MTYDRAGMRHSLTLLSGLKIALPPPSRLHTENFHKSAAVIICDVRCNSFAINHDFAIIFQRKSYRISQKNGHVHP